MTQATANKWWNSVASPGSLSGPPVRPRRSIDIERVMKHLAPVLHANINFLQRERLVWTDICSFVSSLVKINPFPDPNYDLQAFVLYLYTFRTLFHLTTVKDSLIYINEMCPSPPGDFFFNAFWLSATPEITFRTMCELETTKHRKWSEFLDQSGIPERLFDLYLPYLNREAVLDEEVLTHLARLLTSVLMDHSDAAFWDRSVSNLIKAIVSLMETASTSPSIELMRCIGYIGNKLIANSMTGKCSFLISKLRNVSKKSAIFNGYLLSWISDNTTALKESTVIVTLAQDDNIDVTMFTVFDRLINLVSSDNLLTIITILAKIMIMKWLWARSCAAVLLKAFRADKFGARMCIWFKRYMALCFMVIKHAWSLKKYRNRLLIWISIIAGEDFQSIDWIRETAIENVQKSGCEWLSSFFPVTEFTNDKIWNKNYTNIQTYDKSVMKFLPFKSLSLRLVTTRNLYEDEKTAKTISPEVAGLNLTGKYAPYVTFDDKQTRIDQIQNIFDLEDALNMRKSTATQKSQNQISRSRLDMSPFSSRQRWLIKGAAVSASDCEYAAQKMYENRVNSLVDEGMKLIGYMKEDPRIKVNVYKAMSHFDKGIQFKPEYVKLRQQAGRIQMYYVNVVAMFANDILSLEKYLTAIFLLADPTTRYSPPSPFDDLLADRLDLLVNRSLVNSMCSAVSTNPGEAVPAIQNVVNEISKRLSVNDHLQFVVYHSIVRYAFDITYSSGHTILSKSDEYNETFVSNCEKLSQMKLGMVKFANQVFSKMQCRRTIRELYSQESISSSSLEVLSFMTSPNDMAHTIMLSQANLLRLMDGEACHSDTVKLLYGLIVSFPVVNAVSICKFLKQCMAVLNCDIYREAAQCFIEACEMIVNSDV